MAPPKKFKYKMQKIQDMRERKESELKAALANSVRTRDLEVAALNTLVEKRAKAQKSLEACLSRGDVAEVQSTNLYLQNVGSKVDSQNRVVSKINTSVEETRKKLTQASKDRKIIEKHREKKHQEWKYEFQKHETKLFDEIAAQIVSRNSRKKLDDLEEENRYIEKREKKKLMLALMAKNKKK